jgi:predicted nuclease of predicted toxin-antitoxin system
MKLLVDMNLSPDWVSLLSSHGWETCHWSTIGPGNAPDTVLMTWAREHQQVVLTQDLDFSQLLYTTRESGPSVVLLRMDNEFDAAARDHVCSAIALAEASLTAGALLTISGHRVRLRHLPFSQTPRDDQSSEN